MIKAHGVVIVLSAINICTLLFAAGCIGQSGDIEGETDGIEEIEAAEVLSEDGPPGTDEGDAGGGSADAGDAQPEPWLPDAAKCQVRSCDEI